ncbi:glycoside hydrolase family 43 protein [Solirubrobacter sp. CPCC 204708]|uniref:Glycoside hydrolase family 43 protein n=1 Tax=Solirubrobacter deserti TaxID=2282478 RepID=A0ABT4RFI5_9ACTN|nr:glycoside hydrolase family 43 protein [Solirubrobacter deserti]MBE2319431.1 glycoside hydrolase family 43 protein [Solirubrobacter deserti]MDA0137285.1 glycoside hydrolase family 43 protein [Solirubrobacter deserti]
MPDAGRTFVNPVITDDRGADHGDPFVIRHLGEYFLYHTTDDGDLGVSVWRSGDLVDWEFEGHALEPQPGTWAETDLWAPEVRYHAGTFYMYVAGTRIRPDGHGVESARRQGVARADNPLGPFVLDDAPLVTDVWSIDGHPFQDEDGSLWLFYNIRTGATRFGDQPGSGNVVDRLVGPAELEGNPTPVAFPSQRWEGSAAGDAYWNEGSWVLKRRGRYHQLYSGSHYRDATYGIGLTSARTLRGPWVKDPDPILRSGERITGPGHHSVILAPDGVTTYAVYHGYDRGQPGRKVHLDRVHWCGDRPVIGSGAAVGHPTEDPQPVPPGPVHDAAVPFWHADLFVQGPRLSIGELTLDLDPSPRPWRVRISQGWLGMRVWVDGRLRLQTRGLHTPDLACDGELLECRVTSHVEDEAVRWLTPGEEFAWPWGGTGPFELSLAVRGSARVVAGDASTEITSPVERFALVRLNVPRGADEVVVTGLDRGAEVTDMVVTAR